MNYTSLTKKRQERPERARKPALSRVSLGVFLLSTLTAFFAFLYVVSSATIFNVDFDDYEVGTLAGQDGWTCSYNAWEVSGGDYYSSPYAAKDEAQSFVAQCQKDGATSTEGSLSFYVKTENCGYGATRREKLEFRFSGSPFSSYPNITILNNIDDGCYIFFSPLLDYDYVDAGSFDDWVNVRVRWKVEDEKYWFRWGWGSNQETDWTESSYTIGDFPDGFGRIVLYGTYGAGGEYFWVDEIEEAVEFCSLFSSFNACTAAGCCWDYLPGGLAWGGATSYCTACPTGECGSGYNDCQNCLTQETCEAEDFCFWYLGTCRYGETACSGTSLGLCDNQTDCENAGGYWYDDFCWYSEKPNYFISWDDWYAEHGNYATPTEFVNDIASSTQGFFNAIGGFFGKFTEIFNLTEAYANGSGLGSAVPRVRGYLSIVNEFVGGFPLGQTLILFLILMLAISIFRAMSRLVQLLKFW
jgi:hypothetical protein